MKRDDTKLLIDMMQTLLNGGSFSVKALEKKYEGIFQQIRGMRTNSLKASPLQS